MTTVLESLRRLEAANRDGELDDTQYIAARTRLLANIEDAEIVADPMVHTKLPSAVDLALMLIVALSSFFIFTALTAWALDDLTLAFTLSITLLGMFTIRAFQRMQGTR